MTPTDIVLLADEVASLLRCSPSQVRTLTPRELEAMDLLAANPGWTNKVLAHELGTGLRQVGRLLGGAFAKYGAANRTEAVLIHVARRAVA